MTTTTKAAGSGQLEQGTLHELDPATLGFWDNIRSDLALTDGFVDSIRTMGVLVPVSAAYDTLGALSVVDGQRRVHAARTAGLATVPVWVVPAPGDEADRILTQDIVNFHREGLSPEEEVAAFEQLAAFGLTADQIAAKTARPTDVVQAGLKLAAAAPTSDVVTAGADAGLDLVRLAALAEFDDDEETRDQLVGEAQEHGVGAFDHELARARLERRIDGLRAAAIARYEAAGYTIFETWVDAERADRLTTLTSENGQTRLTEEAHAECPGRAVQVHGHFAQGTDDLAVTHYCTNWVGNGHSHSWKTATGKTAASSEDADEAAREERRRVIANNKAAVAAAEVRAQFVEGLLQRAKLPANAPAVVAQIHRCAGPLDYHNSLAYEWRGQEYGTAYELRQSVEGAKRGLTTAAQGVHWLLASALAAVEGTMSGTSGKDWWRRVSTVQLVYLSALEKWGYTLSELEQEALLEGAKS